ncbi:MAG: YdiY family protein [Pseudomonadota bacterium]|jgi:putative salt-induced outer membrane protein YdiY
MKFHRLYLVITVAASMVSSAFAQPANKSNTFASKPLEGAPKKAAPVACGATPKDPALWDKSITAGYNYTDGNSKTASLNLNGKVMRDYDGEAWRFEADYNYGNAAADVNSVREVVKQNARALADYKHTLDSVFFAGANASYAWDEIANLDYRVILSPNVGAYLVKNDVTTFSLEAGPSYVWEQLGGEDDNFAAARIADRFVWNISESALLYQSAEYLVAFDDSADYIVNAEIGIEAPLSSSVNLVLSVRDYYINQPAEGRERNDVYTITGLKVNL